MDVEAVVEKLGVLGFFKFVPAAKQQEMREAVRWELRTRGSLDGRIDRNVYPQEPWQGARFFHADAEGLAESGVGNFLWRVVPMLRHESVELKFLADLESWDSESGVTRYDVLVNDDRYEIFRFDERSELNIWDISHRRTVEIVNELLRRGGSPECAFGAGSGNDASLYILTSELYDYMRTLPLDPIETPKRTDEMTIGTWSR